MARLIDSGPGCPTPTPIRAKNAAEARGLAYTDEIKAKTDDLYPLVSDFITPMEWPAIAPLVAEINRLKEEKNAVILARQSFRIRWYPFSPGRRTSTEASSYGSHPHRLAPPCMGLVDKPVVDVGVQLPAFESLLSCFS